MPVTKPHKPPTKRERESVILSKVRLLIGARRDIMAYRSAAGVYRPLNGNAVIRVLPTGTPDILGTQLRCVMRVHTVREDSFQPFEKKKPLVYGQAFAIETKTHKGVLSKEQHAWRNAFESVGGLYIVARAEADVLKALGKEPDDHVVDEWLTHVGNW